MNHLVRCVFCILTQFDLTRHVFIGSITIEKYTYIYSSLSGKKKKQQLKFGKGRPNKFPFYFLHRTPGQTYSGKLCKRECNCKRAQVVCISSFLSETRVSFFLFGLSTRYHREMVCYLCGLQLRFDINKPKMKRRFCWCHSNRGPVLQLIRSIFPF